MGAVKAASKRAMTLSAPENHLPGGVTRAATRAQGRILFKPHPGKRVEEPAAVRVAAVWQCFADLSERRPGDEAQQHVERRLRLPPLAGQHRVHHELTMAGDDAGALPHRSPCKKAR